MHTRKCAGCPRLITLCNGFVHAGDMMLHWAGLLPGESIRELCYTCVERWCLEVYGWEAAWPAPPVHSSQTNWELAKLMEDR